MQVHLLVACPLLKLYAKCAGTDEEGLKYPHGLYMHALNRETEEVLSTVRAAWMPNPKYRLRPTNAPKTVEMGRTLVVCCHGGQTRQIQTYIVAQVACSSRPPVCND